MIVKNITLDRKRRKLTEALVIERADMSTTTLYQIEMEIPASP